MIDSRVRGIRTLYMWCCDQPAITDAAFLHLRGIHTLMIECCDQATITGAAFAHLRGIQVLGMWECTDEQLAAAESLGLPATADSDCSWQGGLLWGF